jgi:hypothetical protein
MRETKGVHNRTMVYKEEQFFLAKKLKKGQSLVKSIRKSLIIKQLGEGFFLIPDPG